MSLEGKIIPMEIVGRSLNACDKTKHDAAQEIFKRFPSLIKLKGGSPARGDGRELVERYCLLLQEKNLCSKDEAERAGLIASDSLFNGDEAVRKNTHLGLRTAIEGLLHYLPIGRHPGYMEHNADLNPTPAGLEGRTDPVTVEVFSRK